MDFEEYTTLRQKNISARNVFLHHFFADIKEEKNEIKKLEDSRKNFFRINEKEKENTFPIKKRKSIRQLAPYLETAASFESIKKYNTRSRRKKFDDDPYAALNKLEDHENSEQCSNSFKVMFSWAKPIQRDIELLHQRSDDEYFNGIVNFDNRLYKWRKRRYTQQIREAYDPNTIPSPDEITVRMLNNVADRATGKIYDKANGTSCHQCRQKTRDTKTVCRSGRCVGVRGQFCGPCLRGRYGEHAMQVLKDPLWACPPCRGLCNCSICRTKKGKKPTGILAPQVKEEGFTSVKDYLLVEEADTELDSD